MNIAVIFFSLSAAIAQASPLSCNTNPDGDPNRVTMSIVIQDKGNELEATTRIGGNRVITAPQIFRVQAKLLAKEATQYSNEDGTFRLTVLSQPTGGKIHGTLVQKVYNDEYSEPVTCKAPRG